MKRVNVREAFLELANRTDPESISNIPLLVNWAKQCEKKIGSYYGYKWKAALLTISGIRVALPSDCMKVKRVLWGDHTSELESLYEYYNTPLGVYTDDGGGVSLSGGHIASYDEIERYWSPLNGFCAEPMLWHEEGDYLSFASNYDGQDVTVWYQYIEMNVDLTFDVNESHIEAIVSYLQLRLAEKEKWRQFRSDKMMRNSTFSVTSELRSLYHRAVRNAVAEDDRENPFNKANY